MSDSLYTGWPLGVPDASGRLAYSRDANTLREALWNLLLTSPGERLMRPTFGAGLNRWIGQPNTASTRQLIASSVAAAISRWEARVIVSDVSVTTDPDNATRVIVAVTYAARGTPGAPPEQLALTLSLVGA
jgi:phage baseplate assembly protein W